MAHGYPDWGLYTPKKTTYLLPDLAELAVRLGSIVTFDRRGDVIFLDDFEKGIQKWVFAGSGTGAGAVNSTESARNGEFSVKLTTGDAAGDYARLTRYSFPPVLSKIGFEISFTSDANVRHHQWGIGYYDGTNVHEGHIRFDVQNSNLQYYGDDAAWHIFATDIRVYGVTYLFHTIKLVIDIENDRYTRFLFDEKSYDLSAYALNVAGSVLLPCLGMYIEITTNIAANLSIYVDDAIITQNEP